MLLLIISATYAYFSVTITGNGSKTMITANTPKKHSLSVSTLYDDIHIHVDNNDMKLANVGSYYGAVNNNRYEKTKEEGTHNIIEVSSKGMENIRYSCSGDIKVTLNIDNGSMGSVLEKEDVLLYLKGLGLDETLDLSTLKMNNTKIYTTTFEIDGDSSDYLRAIVELINKESYQNYIANKMLNVKIEAENMVCHENGTYKYLVKLNKSVKEIQNGKEVNKYNVSIFYDEEGIYQKIQNVYFVDYINTSKAIKTWELGDTNRGTKSDEVMGWLEKTPNENDSYDLYIGSKGPMRAPKDMDYAFNSFTNLKKISGNALDTSEVISLSNTFVNCTNLVDIGALAYWDVSKVTNTSYMFYGTQISDLTPIRNWNVSNVTNMAGMFYGTQINDLSQIANWNVSHVTTTNHLFNKTKISDITPLKNWNLSSITSISYMFSNTLIADINLLKSWDISEVTNISGLFYNTPISDLTPIKDWDTSKVTNMESLFYNCKNLVDISALNDWDVSHVTNMASIFQGCDNLMDLNPISNWKVSSVTTMIWMFLGVSMSDLTPLKDWDTSKVTDMYGMFSSCQNLTNLTGLENWNVSKVTRMYRTFSNTPISDLTALSKWKVSSLTNMAGMFSSCKNITSLTGLENWDVSKVTDMSNMFTNDSNLKDVTAIANWNVSSVTGFGEYGYGGMFQECIGLTKVDLSKWQTPKLTSVSRMFGGCTNLIELKLPQAPYNSISNVNSYQAFLGGDYVGAYNRGTMGSVKDNIAITVDATQESWVKDRLIEANVTNATINGKPMSSVS